MPSEERPQERIVRIEVNGRPTTGLVEPRTLLSDYLRNHVGLTGTNVGCEHGVCGACTVRIDGEIARSCIAFAAQVDGGSVETVESLAPSTAELHPIQRAFEAEHGLQCGFCTPGFLIATQALLERNLDPSEDEIREFLSGNICRCTGYVGIVNAVKTAARAAREEGGGAG